MTCRKFSLGKKGIQNEIWEFCPVPCLHVHDNRTSYFIRGLNKNFVEPIHIFIFFFLSSNEKGGNDERDKTKDLFDVIKNKREL